MLEGKGQAALALPAPAEISGRLAVLEAETAALREQAERLRTAALDANPRWAAIARYTAAGLKRWEIAKLLGLSGDTVRKEKRRMEAAGLLAAGADV